jgi:hypothetical protein
MHCGGMISLSVRCASFPLNQTQIGQVVGLSIAIVNRATQSLRKRIAPRSAAVAISGHRSIAEVQRYCSAADQARMARAASAKARKAFGTETET